MSKIASTLHNHGAKYTTCSMLLQNHQDSLMKAQQRKDFRTSVILSEDQHLKLNVMAVENDVSVAWLIRQAITGLLDNNDGAIGTRLPKKNRK